jgi:hypothetical protein
MDITNFLTQLKTYKEFHGTANNVNFLNFIIDDVKELVEEIKNDHLQGDADDADRDEE